MSDNLPFFRKSAGGGPNWGAGLDYLFKDSWRDLDCLVKENYLGQHNKVRIVKLHKSMLLATELSVLEMSRLCKNKGPDFTDWVDKANHILNFGRSSSSLSEKVVFVTTALQFLRATTWEDKPGEMAIKPPFKTTRTKPIRTVRELKGTVASMSGVVVTGIAKIVLNDMDVEKVTKNDVLIAYKTKPQYLKAMVLARAFVTDVGGLLCHAAITAREFKKPCIVGTIDATTTFSDGDLVEVDTVKGIVKKI